MKPKKKPPLSKSSYLNSLSRQQKAHSQVSSFLLVGTQLSHIIDLFYFCLNLQYFMMFTSEIATDNSVLTFCEILGDFFFFNSVYMEQNPFSPNKIYFVTTWKVCTRFCLALVIKSTPYVCIYVYICITILHFYNLNF